MIVLAQTFSTLKYQNGYIITLFRVKYSSKHSIDTMLGVGTRHGTRLPAVLKVNLHHAFNLPQLFPQNLDSSQETS